MRQLELWEGTSSSPPATSSAAPAPDPEALGTPLHTRFGRRRRGWKRARQLYLALGEKE